MALVEPPSSSHLNLNFPLVKSSATIRPWVSRTASGQLPYLLKRNPNSYSSHIKPTSRLSHGRSVSSDTSDDLENEVEEKHPQYQSSASLDSTWLRPNLSRNHTHTSKTEQRRPFSQWVRSIHRKAKPRQPLSPKRIRDACVRPMGRRSNRSSVLSASNRRSSCSESSLKFVNAVQSATISIAGTSFVAKSRKSKARSKRCSRTDHSSRASFTGPRASEDSLLHSRPPNLDLAAVERSFQRRKIVEELIKTEEGYIGDIRYLMSVRSPVTHERGTG